MKKRDYRVKTRKGSLEQKEILKDSWAEQANEWRVDNQKASEASTSSSTPSNTEKSKPSIQEFPFPNF